MSVLSVLAGAEQIVEAFLHYMENGEPVVAPRAPVLTREQVKQIVLEVLRKNSQESSHPPKEEPDAHTAQNARAASSGEKAVGVATGFTRAEKQPAENLVGSAKKAIDLDDTALDQINDALEMFGEI